MKLYRQRGYSQFYYNGQLDSVICTSAHIKHSFSAILATRHDALRCLARRHPIFRAGAYARNNEVYAHIPAYTSDYDTDRQLLVAEGRWQDICIQQTNTHVNREQGPLFWLVLVPDTDDSGHILICCDHMFSDGMSCVILLHDFLNYRTLDSSELPVLSVMDLFNINPDSIWRRSLSFLLYKYLARMYHQHTLFFPQDEKHRAYFDTGSAENKEALIRKCHEMKVSVHGALMACSLLATAHSGLSPSNTIDIDVAIDLRRRFSKPLGPEHVGNMYGATRVPFSFDQVKKQRFWDVALNAQKFTRQGADVQDIATLVVDKIGQSKELFDGIYGGKMQSDFIISNLGQYPFDDQLVDSLHVYASHKPIGSQAAFWVASTDKMTYSGGFCFEGEHLFRDFVNLCENCWDIPHDAVFEDLLQSK